MMQVGDLHLGTAGGWLPVTVTLVIAAVAMAATAHFWHATPLKCRRLDLWIGRIMSHLAHCHQLYIRSRRPFRIILMRHAESEGNVDKGIYSSTPDHALKITDRGKRQAAVAGSELKKLIGDESVYFIVSPYTRTRMTYDIVRKELGDRQSAMREDPRLRELDFGNFQDLDTMRETMETRKAYGRFWFRFMNGESGSDVYDRATAFWESVFRSMDHTTSCRFKNYVIVTHGLMMRLILMRYFQWKVEFFERVWNPDNCETWVMERDERGSYRVVTEILDRPAWATPVNEPDSSSTEGIQQTGDVESTNNTAQRESVAQHPPENQRQEEEAGAASRSASLDDQSPERRQSVRKLSVDLPLSEENSSSDGGGEERYGGFESRHLNAVAVPGIVHIDSAEAMDSERTVRCRSDPRCSFVRTPLPTTRSALNLNDGGFAPGEEGCGRDEEL